MELLLSLGLNETFAYQFAIFLCAFTLSYFIAFRPYFAAYVQRQERTTGDLEAAEKIKLETREITEKYEKKAKQFNAEFKRIYDKSRTEARKEAEVILQDARTKAKTLLDQTRDELHKQYSLAQQSVDKEAEALSAAISTRMLNHERIQ